MRSKVSCLILVFFSVSIVSLVAKPWPAWRGDLLGSGHTPETSLPLEWGPEKNVNWRVDLPEPGNSTPAVWGDRVFVTQPVSDDHSRNLMCFDRDDGSLSWKMGVVYEKEERTHRRNPYCSASPAVDEDIVVVSHGSAGVFAYDHEGNERWRRDLGPIDHTWGNSSSPVLYGDLVIHYHGPGAENTALYAFDRESGETVWKWDEPQWDPGERTDGFRGRSEDGVIGSFSTPIVVDAGERTELIMSFPMEMKAFAPETGEVLWTCRGLNPLVYTSPVYDDGVVVAMGGFHGSSIAVEVGGNGDVTDSHRLWQKVRHNGGVGSGVAKNGKLYYQTSGGIAYCLDMRSGENEWEARLPGAGKSWGSFVLSGDRIYTLSQAGDTVVFEATPEKFEVLARSDLGEETNSSLAPSDGDIFVRTHEALWCVSGSDEQSGSQSE